MKSKIFSIAIMGFAFLYSTYAQNVPNGGFEDWEMRLLYEEPETWNTGNQEAFLYNASTASSTADSYSGDLALRLETVVAEEDTLFGYAMCNGIVTGGEVSDTLHFEGGIPVSAAPDSLFGYFKFEIPENDTGLVLVSFKSAGDIISQTFYPITGTQNSYTLLGFEIETMTETPDTALVAFTCSNPDNVMTGGWLQVDSVWWDGIDDSISNADFEVWEEASYQDPENWITANLFAYLFGGDIAATPTADAHSGSFALRLEAIETAIPADEGMTEAVAGFAIAYEESFNFTESLPTFPIDFNPTALTGYYKFEPVLNDTALLYISLADDAGNTLYEIGTYLTEASTYQAFEITIDYSGETPIALASIVVSTTKYFMQTGENSGEIGSVLYFDDLDLFNPCDTFPPYSIASVIPADCSDYTASIDAGDGWDEYLWSNEETTQVIWVTVNESEVYSVTVTNNLTGCQFSDEVELFPPDGCGTAVQPKENTVPGIALYPNPTTDILIIEFQNLKLGIYTIEVLDITGKIILSERIFTCENKKKVILDLTEYTEGLYLIKIQGEKFSHCEKLMIK